MFNANESALSKFYPLKLSGKHRFSDYFRENRSYLILSGLLIKLTFTCSKSTIETPEKVVKYVQS